MVFAFHFTRVFFILHVIKSIELKNFSSHPNCLSLFELFYIFICVAVFVCLEYLIKAAGVEQCGLSY